MFKKGVFELGATIVPVAIKYKYARCVCVVWRCVCCVLCGVVFSSVRLFTWRSLTIYSLWIHSKLFSDAFWHSRKESFAWYLVRLMTSWCVVCDVYYLDPVEIMPGETGEQFATRVKVCLCVWSNLVRACACR